MRKNRDIVGLCDKESFRFSGMSESTQMEGAMPQGTRLGHCEIRRVLGRGGGGISYLAYDAASYAESHGAPCSTCGMRPVELFLRENWCWSVCILPGQGDIAEDAEQPEIQRNQGEQVPENDAHSADQLAGLVGNAAATKHNLLVLPGEDDIFIR